MTDAFEVTGETSLVAPISSVLDDLATAVEVQDAVDTTPNGFVSLGLAPELVQAVADLGYTQPTTVQLKTIPLALPSDNAGTKKGFIDLMVSSQTGSGKTAAFLLPVIHTLLKQLSEAAAADRAAYEKSVADAIAKGEEPPKKPKRKDPTNARNFKAPSPGALIVCPTRELAQQVAHDAIDLVKHCRGLRVANVVGGMPYQLQIAKLQNANLVVATPGRLLDLQRSMQIKLDKVQFLVVDEADRMLDLGFADDLAEINQLTIDRKQTMMFSATFAPRIQQLATRVMRQPQRVQIDTPQEKHNNIRQVLHWADNAHHKRKLLDHLLRDTTINQAIVFASTQIECDGLANDLQQDGFSAVALHGALSQGLRNRRLMALRQGQVQFLVATDVAARGIDVPTITHVFNFGLPMKSEDYTHRIGRTGRAGRDGIAVTLAEFRDKRKIYDIEAFTRQPFTAEVVTGLEPTQRVERGRDFAPRKGASKFDAPRRNHGGGFGGKGGGFVGGHRAGGSNFGGRSEGGFGSDNRFAAAPARSFDDRPARGPRPVFEGDRSPFEKKAARPKSGGGKPFGGGFDAKKRSSKPKFDR